MAVSRRHLLGLGAAVAVSVATSSCRARPTEAHASTSPSVSPAPSDVPSSPAPTSAPTSAPPAEPAFYGQPPAGSLYYGASFPHDRSLPAWEHRLGNRLALNRSFFSPDHNETFQLVHRCRDDLEEGRLPHVSTKVPGTWRQLADGGRDPWLAGILRGLGDPATVGSGPIFLTLHHEPENDAGPPGMQPADYVAMQARAIRLAAELAPAVTVVPILQQWTFDPSRHDIDPSAWLVPDAAVIGLDVYNPWSPTNGKQWRSFGGKVDETLHWFEGKPLAIGEYGCHENPDVPGLAANWLREAADYAREHGIVSMSYFNSDVGADQGDWTLTGDTEVTFAELLASDWVFRPQ